MSLIYHIDINKIELFINSEMPELKNRGTRQILPEKVI